VEVFSFFVGVVHDSVLLGYDVASVGNRFPTFRRTAVKNQTPRTPTTMMARRFFETPGTSDPVTWLLVPEERNPGVLGCYFHCFTVHFNLLCIMVQPMHLFVIKH
jgi:hypothetical protein